MLELYVPCDVCNEPVDNDMDFHRRENNGWRQYGLCNKHLPNTPRVFIWTNNLRVGRFWATALGLGTGYGGCYKCGTPWDCIRSHSTTYLHGSGMFPLCQPCWQELTPQQRIPYYMKLVDRWEHTSNTYNGHSFEELRQIITRAVLEEV